MADSNPEYNRQELREHLTRSFSKDEIKIIYFDLGVDYEEFDNSKPILIIELLKHLERKRKLPLLREWLEKNDDTRKQTPKNTKDKRQIAISENLSFLRGFKLAELEKLIITYELEISSKFNANMIDSIYLLVNEINSNPDALDYEPEVSSNFNANIIDAIYQLVNEINSNLDFLQTEIRFHIKESTRLEEASSLDEPSDSLLSNDLNEGNANQ